MTTTTTPSSSGIRAHHKRDGLLLIDNRTGHCRYATLRERIVFRLFKLLPQRI